MLLFLLVVWWGVSGTHSVCEWHACLGSHAVNRQPCEVDCVSLPLHGFPEPNKGHQVYTLSAFIHWPIVLAPNFGNQTCILVIS